MPAPDLVVETSPASVVVASALPPNFEAMDLIVTVPDDEVEFVKQVLGKMNFSVKPAAKVTPAGALEPKKYTPEQQEWIDDFREALHEVELHQQGKIKLKTANELLDELRNNNLD